MSSRVAGAGFALIAAALLAVSIATPVVLPEALSLFSGHPTVNDHTRETQDVYVGLYEAELCNSGGDGSCKQGNSEERAVFRYTGYAELGATGVLAVSLMVLAVLTLWKSERRRGAAGLVMFAAVVAGAGTVGLIVVGPFQVAAIPLGLGMAIHGAGIVVGLLASVIAARAPRPIKLRVAERSQQLAAIASPQPFDVHALFRDDPRPSAPRPEPRRPRDGRAWPRAGGEVPQSTGVPEEAADPFASPVAPPPALPAAERSLVSPAPQLRPLYEATPLQGGTGGLLPIERPTIPSRPPTPVSRASIDADTGIPAPPPFATERPKPKTLPPSFTPRAKQPSAAPPIPVGPPGPLGSLGPSPRTQVSLVPPMPDNDLPIAPPTARVALITPAPQVLDTPYSDGMPDGTGSPPNTEPTQFPTAETLLATLPAAAMPRPRSETPLAPPPSPSPVDPGLPVDPDPPFAASPLLDPSPPPLDPSSPPVDPSPPPLAPPPVPKAPPPRPHRESQVPPPPPRPQRDTQAPRTTVRAAVPMPVRPVRPVIPPTRPPPIAMTGPLRGTPPRPTISSPAAPPPGIPPIPAIPAIPAIPRMPPIRALGNRAETDPEPFDPAVDQATISRAPLEIGDSTSQTSMSFDMMTTDEVDPAVDDAGAPRPGQGTGPGYASDDELAPHARPTEIGPAIADTSPTGEPVGSVQGAHASSPERHGGAMPGPGPEWSSPGLPVAIAIPAPTPAVRDRPMPKLPISTAPDSLPPPRDTKQQAGPSPACPQCESPMAWVEEHLRFYCKSCRMYF